MKTTEAPFVRHEETYKFDKISFFAALAIATVFPIVFNIAFNKEDGVPIGHVFGLLAIMSTMHVALTGYFFYDREYRKHMLNGWMFYFLLPIALIITLGALTFLYGKQAENHVWVIYHAWLL